MFIETPQPVCIKCGAQNTEIFLRQWIKGIRCIECGHEKITDDVRKGMESSVYSISKDDGKQTF